MDHFLSLLFPQDAKPYLKLAVRVDGVVVVEPDDTPVNGVKLATITDLEVAQTFKRRVEFLLLADAFVGLTLDSKLDVFEVELRWLAQDLQGVEVDKQIPLESFIRCELVDEEVRS